MQNWISRWLYSTNHKDIGTLYIYFGLISGLFGVILSLLIRTELAQTGSQILQSNFQFYNVVITRTCFYNDFLYGYANNY